MTGKENLPEFQKLQTELKKTQKIATEKHEALVKADKILTEPTQSGFVDKLALENYYKAAYEAHIANSNWAIARDNLYKFYIN